MEAVANIFRSWLHVHGAYMQSIIYSLIPKTVMIDRMCTLLHVYRKRDSHMYKQPIFRMHMFLCTVPATVRGMGARNGEASSIRILCLTRARSRAHTLLSPLPPRTHTRTHTDATLIEGMVRVSACVRVRVRASVRVGVRVSCSRKP